MGARRSGAEIKDEEHDSAGLDDARAEITELRAKLEAVKTVLDQLHQSMILFGAGRGEALKRFLVEEGIGRNPLYWATSSARPLRPGRTRTRQLSAATGDLTAIAVKWSERPNRSVGKTEIHDG